MVLIIPPQTQSQGGIPNHYVHFAGNFCHGEVGVVACSEHSLRQGELAAAVVFVSAVTQNNSERGVGRGVRLRESIPLGGLRGSPREKIREQTNKQSKQAQKQTKLKSTLENSGSFLEMIRGRPLHRLGNFRGIFISFPFESASKIVVRRRLQKPCLAFGFFA